MIVPILALAILAPQKLQLDVNAKDGVVVTGERVFRVTVQSKAPVTQVEFYVNDELRETDTSTPYEFKVDSLSESEGSMKVKFSAYNTEGQSASRVLNVRIDNLSGMSPDEHIAKGRDLLTVSKWDEAILRGRIANKAKPNYAPALILLGRGYLGKGVLDSAQKFAEDAVAADPNSIEAAELLAYVNLQKAFNTFNRGGDRKETLGVIRTALKTAVETRTRLLAQAFEKLGPQTDSGMLAWSDAAMKAGRFQTAVNVLQPAFTKDNRRNDVGNRLAYAYLRMGRIADAYSTLDATKKYGTLDAYGYALLAITEAERGNAAASDDAMREAILSEGDNLGVRTAQTYIALKRGNAQTLRSLATALGKDEGQRSEVQLYLMALANSRGDFAGSRTYFERGVLAEPTNYALFVERGNESVAIALSGRLAKADADLELESAGVMYETALIARPESQEALTGMAILLLLQGKTADGERYATAAARTGSAYAPAFFALAAAHAEMARKVKGETPRDTARMAAEHTNQAEKALATAAKLDKTNLEGRPLPTPRAAFQYFGRYGRTALLVAPK